MRTRFAPSPTGYLHLGHAFSALIAWRLADRQQDQFILRIEDIDRTRCHPHFEEAIYEDLDWLGIRWRTPVRRQQAHFADYRTALDRLRANGLVYRCFRTRKERAEAASRAPQQGDEPAVTAGEAMGGVPHLKPIAQQEQAFLQQNKPYSWRFDMQAAADLIESGGMAAKGQKDEKKRHKGHDLCFKETGAGPNGETGPVTSSLKAIETSIGDAIIGRKDNGTSYHLACIVDDALQGITDIVRGNDLFWVTPFHVLLQELLGLPTPRYHHHAILRDETGIRLAKRHKSESLRSLRKSGVSADEIMDLCCALAGR